MRDGAYRAEEWNITEVSRGPGNRGFRTRDLDRCRDDFGPVLGCCFLLLLDRVGFKLSERIALIGRIFGRGITECLRVAIHWQTAKRTKRFTEA